MGSFGGFVAVVVVVDKMQWMMLMDSMTVRDGIDTHLARSFCNEFIISTH